MQIRKKSQAGASSEESSSSSQLFCFQENELQHSQKASESQSLFLSQYQSGSEEKSQSKPKKWSNQQNELGLNQNLKQIEANLHQKQTLKKTVAEALIKKKKLNCDIIKQQLKNKNIGIFLNSDKYKSTIQSVATEIIRAVQRFLHIECNIQVQPLSRSGIEIILRKIINYQQYFDKPTGLVLRNFIRYLYELQEVQIQKAKVYHLYQKIVDLTFKLNSDRYKTTIFKKVQEKWERPQLKIKADSKLKELQPPEGRFTTMDEVNKQWNEQYEQFLVKCYKQSQDFTRIRSSFCEVYPKKKHLWSVDCLKNRFERTIRRAFNRLKIIIECEADMKKTNLPELINMDQRLIKILISRMYPIQLRLKFIDLLEGKKDRELVSWLILSINAELKGSKKNFYSLNLSKKTAKFKRQ